jgi:hypothetical protein
LVFAVLRGCFRVFSVGVFVFGVFGLGGGLGVAVLGLGCFLLSLLFSEPGFFLLSLSLLLSLLFLPGLDLLVENIRFFSLDAQNLLQNVIDLFQHHQLGLSPVDLHPRAQLPLFLPKEIEPALQLSHISLHGLRSGLD